MARSNTRGFRGVLLKLHLWVALALAPFLIILGVTGAFTAYAPAYDRARFPALLRVKPQGTRMPLQDVVDRARGVGTPDNVQLPRTADEPIRIYVRDANGVSAVYADPYSGTILGVRSLAEERRGLSLVMRHLHKSLLLGEPGGHVVAIVTIVSLSLPLTGLVLWWPRKIFRLKVGATWPRFNFDLHNVVGLFTSLLILILALSGIVIAYPQVTQFIQKLDTAPAVPPPRSAPPAGDVRPLSLDQIARIVEGAIPGSTTGTLLLPREGSAVIIASARLPEEHYGSGRSRVWLDAFSGKVLRVDNWRQAEGKLGTRLQAFMRWSHVGWIYGPTTVALAFVGSVGQVVLVVTGVLVWWQRRARSSAKVSKCALVMTTERQAERNDDLKLPQSLGG